MRLNEPVYRDDRNGLWGVTRHADLMDVERRSTVFSSAQSYRAVPSQGEVNMIAQDDPRHRQQRMLVQGNFTKKSVEQRQAETNDLVTEVLDAALADGADAFEVVDAVSGQIPARLTARLLGYPEQRWADPPRTDRRRTAPSRSNRTRGRPVHLGRRRDHPHGNQSRAASVRRPPRPVGGDGRRPRPRHRGRGRGAEVGHTAQNMFRRVAADDRIGDQSVQQGDRVVLLYPSANRDEDVFDDPYRFDIGRSPSKHVAFGFGTHLCIGTHVARSSLAATFGQLSRRITDLHAISEPEVERNIFARAVVKFDLGFTQR